MPGDLSPVLPEKVSLFFTGRRCSGNPNDVTPLFYRRDVPLSTVTFTDTTVDPKPLGMPSSTHIIHDACQALWNVGVANATNKTNLDALAFKIAQDFYDYKSQSFDVVFNGICGVVPTSLIDVIEYTYVQVDLPKDERESETEPMEGTVFGITSPTTNIDETTRVTTEPWNGDVEEMQHYDPVTKDCTDANNSGNPISPIPCMYYYGPPEACEGGGGAAHATIVDGVITAITRDNPGTYGGVPTVAISGDGTGATAHVTLAGGGIDTIVVDTGGTGYTYAIISFKGGGTKLQRTRYLLCLEDGRLISKFVSYDTIG